jgi:hypothetical protein
VKIRSLPGVREVFSPYALPFTILTAPDTHPVNGLTGRLLSRDSFPFQVSNSFLLLANARAKAKLGK